MSKLPTPGEVLHVIPAIVDRGRLGEALMLLGVPVRVVDYTSRATILPDRLVLDVVVEVDGDAKPLTYVVPIDRGPREPVLEVVGEVPCARERCGDGYTLHGVDGVLGGCTVCVCPGFMWVQR